MDTSKRNYSISKNGLCWKLILEIALYSVPTRMAQVVNKLS